MGAPVPPAKPRARVVAGYVLGTVLGAGTFGKVRLARKDGVPYAVKILDRALIDTNEWAGKVRREIAIMRALAHPSIVRLHQVIRSPSRVYLVMELVTGGELYYKVQREGALPEALARAYFQQLVDGIAYCHSRGVYHRDLKPENLLLSDDESTLKVTDFGLSAVNPAPREAMLLRTPCGSPHYCAPEVRGRRTAPGYDGARIDAWSCGVILFLLCSGFLPFHDEDPVLLQRQIDAADANFPHDFPPGARAVCSRLLEKDPEQRASLAEVRAHPWFLTDYRPAAPASPAPPDLPRAASAPAPAPTPPPGPAPEPRVPRLVIPQNPRQSVPAGRARTVAKPRRRRLKSALGGLRGSASANEPPTDPPSPRPATHRAPPASPVPGRPPRPDAPPTSAACSLFELRRAPSLTLGDAPASPRGDAEHDQFAAPRRSSFDAPPSNFADPPSKPSVRRSARNPPFKLFAASSDGLKDMRPSDANDPAVGPRSGSLRLFNLGARVLSSFGQRRSRPRG